MFCEPCIHATKYLYELCNQNVNKLVKLKVHVRKDLAELSEINWREQYKVLGVPTLLLLKDGKEVRSEKFKPYFKPRRLLPPYEIYNLSERRVINFILFIRRGKHELKIKTNEL